MNHKNECNLCVRGLFFLENSQGDIRLKHIETLMSEGKRVLSKPNFLKLLKLGCNFGLKQIYVSPV